MHNKFLMGVKFGQVGELPHQFSKSHYYGDFFQKWSPTCDFWKKYKGFSTWTLGLSPHWGRRSIAAWFGMVGSGWSRLSRPRYRPPTPMVVSQSEVKWKWSIFGSLNFFVFGYVEGGVLGYNNIGIKKCRTTFLWVLNFGQVGELPQQFSKSNYYGDFFQKWSPTCDFLKNLHGIFRIKLKAIFYFKGCLLKI